MPLGPIGRYLIQNFDELLKEQRLTYREVSDRLKQIGRPIPTLGLSRISKGTRRVDVDDLIALAVVLETSPANLLEPHGDDMPEDDRVYLAENLPMPARIAGEWIACLTLLPAAPAITWPRSVMAIRTRESEMADMRRRLEQLEALLTKEVEPQPVVAAIVTSPLGVLVGHRLDDKPPWTFIAGEVEPGERPEDAAVREVKEETGLRVAAGEVIGERTHPKTGRKMIYMAARPTHGTDVFVGDSEELAEVRWVGLTEADELMKAYGMFEPVREYLARELGGA